MAVPLLLSGFVARVQVCANGPLVLRRRDGFGGCEVLATVGRRAQPIRSRNEQNGGSIRRLRCSFLDGRKVSTLRDGAILRATTLQLSVPLGRWPPLYKPPTWLTRFRAFGLREPGLPILTQPSRKAIEFERLSGAALNTNDVDNRAEFFRCDAVSDRPAALGCLSVQLIQSTDHARVHHGPCCGQNHIITPSKTPAPGY